MILNSSVVGYQCVVSVCLKLNFPAWHDTSVRLVRVEERHRGLTDSVKPGRTPLLSCLSLQQTSPGTYLQVQVVGRHGNC